jgi:hypothetical protein
MFKLIKDFFEYKKRDKVANSTKPHFVLNTIPNENDDITDGFKVEMDWNKAFVDQLRAAGYQGIGDEKVIEAYLYQIFATARSRSFLDQDLLKHEIDE